MNPNLLIILATTTGALATYYLLSRGVSAVLASCLVGLAGVLLSRWLDVEHLDTAVFTGTFVGMTSLMVLDAWGVGIAGLVAGLVYILLLDRFIGMGGKLGTMAFVSVALVLLIIRFWRA